MVTTLGESLTARDEKGELQVRIATVFPFSRTIVALKEMPIHALQRAEFVESLNRAHVLRGEKELTADEQSAEMDKAVDLFVDEQGVLIRPDPARMDLAFAADELLQEVVPKRSIKYLFLNERIVRDSLKNRGECWRMFLPPSAPAQIRQMVLDARAAIEGRKIYYYSPVSGTRFLTYDNLQHLSELSDADLRQHLLEIGQFSARCNHNGHHEVEFFMANPCVCGEEFQAAGASAESELRARYLSVCEHMRANVPPEYQHDDVDDPLWRRRMFTRLMTQRQDELADDQTMGLDPDFSMRVEWLPGGRIDEGELILDPAIEERWGRQQEKQVSSVVRGLILNLVQEYGDLEYINLGSVLPSPNRNEQRGGRREVYVAQIKQRRAAGEVLQILRMQKWGVRERLDQGKALEDAMIEAEEYTEYVLDRRLACRQLGMNLSVSATPHKVSEQYDGYNERYRGRRIWTPYFQRDYIPGVGTDQLPARKLADAAYAEAFALLLGQAAACNMIVGRAELSGEAVFDVGDEIVVENSSGQPTRIIVADHVGTLVDWNGPLAARAGEYARPVQRRLPSVPDRKVFIQSFVAGFTERFTRIQEEYAKHRRAFDTLFKHRPWDTGGSLAYRWSRVLERLRDAQPKQLGEMINSNIQG